MRTGCIYLITCTVSGKSYVGQTVCGVEKRWKRHIADALYNREDFAFTRAIRKHGADNFTVSVLHDNVPDEELNDLEVKEIAEKKTFIPNGYNSTTGGLNRTTISEETRAKIREARRIQGSPSEETRRKISEANKNRIFSEEHRRKLSIAATLRTPPPVSEEHRRKIGLAMVARGPRSQETRDRISRSHRERSKKRKLKCTLPVLATNLKDGNTILFENGEACSKHFGKCKTSVESNRNWGCKTYARYWKVEYVTE